MKNAENVKREIEYFDNKAGAVPNKALHQPLLYANKFQSTFCYTKMAERR
jgi:hypothetical protein